jgi:hypothetical protein
LLRRLLTEKGYPAEAYACAAVFYGLCAAGMLATEFGTLDLLYYAAWSFRWIGGLVAVIAVPGFAGWWFFTQEFDTWFPKRLLAGWCLGVAFAGAGMLIRSWLNI